MISDPVESARAGGAGLAAVLAARSHENVILIAPVADDADGRRVVDLLPASVQLIPLAWTGSTSVKMRVRAGDHPVARVDRGGRLGDVGPLPAAALTALDQAVAILVADYGLGLTSAEHVRAALAERAPGTPIVWDPHPRGAEPVAGIRLVTPNAVEAAVYAGAGPGQGIAAVAAQAQTLLRRWSAGGIAVTMGAPGALVTVGEGTPLVVPAPVVAASDTCGAGDAFAAAAAVALCSGALPSEAVTSAVAAAAAFVAGRGCGRVRPLETVRTRPPRRVLTRWRWFAPGGAGWWLPVAASICCTRATSPPWKRLARWVIAWSSA